MDETRFATHNLDLELWLGTGNYISLGVVRGDFVATEEFLCKPP